MIRRKHAGTECSAILYTGENKKEVMGYCPTLQLHHGHPAIVDGPCHTVILPGDYLVMELRPFGPGWMSVPVKMTESEFEYNYPSNG